MNEAPEKKLRSLREILDDAKENHFKIFIPSYQRGYRWTGTEVTQLLDDITKDKSGGYFLQLLAVEIVRREQGFDPAVDQTDLGIGNAHG